MFARAWSMDQSPREAEGHALAVLEVYDEYGALLLPPEHEGYHASRQHLYKLRQLATSVAPELQKLLDQVCTADLSASLTRHTSRRLK